MTDLVSKFQEALNSGFPFAVYSKPGSTSVTGIFQSDARNHLPHGGGFIFAPFDGRKTCFIPNNAADVIVSEIPVSSDVSHNFPMPEIDPAAKEAFESLVAKSVTAIRKGDFDKLVVSRHEIVSVSSSVIQIFEKLLQAYPMAFRYCFYRPDSGLWMGATPEQLLKAENNTLHTVALAGTQPYKEGEEAEWGQKEKQEQQFVTDYIVSSLQDTATDIHTTAPYTFRAGNLLHIKTDITAEIGDESIGNILDTLHPTPAVCGLPKEAAMQFLKENEGYEREYYSGYLGEWHYDFATGRQATDLFVNLRCMKINEDKAHLYIGCGITKDSDPEKEFIETINKSMTMRKVIQ